MAENTKKLKSNRQKEPGETIDKTYGYVGDWNKSTSCPAP
jgi:hypothetical protein